MAVLSFKVIAAGDQGREMIEKLKYNFDLIASYADKSTAEMIKRIVSEQIRGIKLENGTLYYTKDLDVENPVWVDMSPKWGTIIGDITKQEDLKKLLESKVSNASFTLLDDRVKSLEGSNEVILIDIGDLKKKDAEVDETLESIFERLSVAETSLLKKITSKTIVEMRQVSKDSPVQYTTDGINWINITGSQFATAWGNIGGDIENQLDLKNKFTTINESISNMSEDITLALNTLESLGTTITGINSELLLHIENTSNPHKVTKSQVGLGNVNNTSDEDKPVSTAQKEYIDSKTREVDDKVTGHTENTENPHNVTKEQIGLGNVDNTKDVDKPVSNAQKTYIENVVQGMVQSAFESNQKLWVGTLAEYQLIVSSGGIEDNCLYVTI